MITGKELAEKLYSEMEENDNLLQEFYEKAFSEGYEYAQKQLKKVTRIKNALFLPLE